MIKLLKRLLHIRGKHTYSVPPMIKMYGNSKYGYKAYIDFNV